MGLGGIGKDIRTREMLSECLYYTPTATLLERTLLAQGFMRGAKDRFASLRTTAKP
jgi:hypothetical protein